MAERQEGVDRARAKREQQHLIQQEPT
jgi:hypothetical protein